MRNRQLICCGRGPLVAVTAFVVGVSVGVSGCSPPPLSPPGDRYQAMSGSSSGPIGLIVAPDDRTASILNAIRSARRRILVEMYMLTDPDALAALLAAHHAGSEVRVLLEPTPYGDAEANQPAFSLLTAAGVDVRWAARPAGLLHAKLLVIDDARAFVMTLNLTTAGLGSNREFAITDSDPVDVGWAQAIWNADATGGDPGSAPGATKLLVSPIDARSRLTAAIDGARSSLAIEIEEISDGDLVSRLIAAHERGVSTTVVTPAAGQSAATAAAVTRMAARGLAVRLLARPTLHAKAMVVDHRQAYVGSVNFTRASLDDNREFGVLLADPAIVARVEATIAADAAAGFAR
jgi:cardiolipin synthase